MPERNRWRKIAIPACYSVVLGIAISVTMTLRYWDIWAGMDRNDLQLSLPVLLRGLGLAVPVFLVVYLLSRLVQRLRLVSLWTGKWKLSDRSFFLMVWGCIILCWLPYLLSYYPAGVVGDGAITIEYAIHADWPMEGRWVIALILVLRLFLTIGSWFSPDINFGVFLFAACSMLLYSAACARLIAELRRRQANPVFLVLCTAFYAVFGHFASFGMNLWKDGLFGAGIVMLSLLLWNMPEQGELWKGWIVKTCLVMAFLCLWRNFISYGFLVAGCLMLLIRGNRKKVLAWMMILVSLFVILIQIPVSSLLNVQKTSPAESLAIPIQQLAAVICCGEEISPEQADVLFSLLPREDWQRLYAPTINDSIKFAFNETYFREHIWDVLRVWLQLLPGNIGIYLKAHLMVTLGFWQPYGSNRGIYYDWYLGTYDLYDRGLTTTDQIFQLTGSTVTQGLMHRMSFIPSGTVVWIMLLSLVLLLCGDGSKKRRLLVFTPYLLCWIVVIFSAPIAYSYRYIEMLAMGLPLIVFLPFAQETATGQTAIPLISDQMSDQRFSGSAKWAAVTGVIIAVGLIAFTGFTTVRIADFSTGKLLVDTAGADASPLSYYVPEGFSDVEADFTWTDGDTLHVEFPFHEDGKDLTVTIYVAGTINGTQRYTILDLKDQPVLEGVMDEAGGLIQFTVGTEQGRAGFSMLLPDAVVASEIIAGSGDERKLAMRITGIEFVVQDP